MHKKLLTFDTERQIPQEKNEGILHSAGHIMGEYFQADNLTILD